MAGPTFADRVQETTTTTGTGSYALGGAVAGYQSFSVVGNGNTCFYAITDGTNWEVGLGTWSTGGTLARTTIEASSNGGAAVSWGSGTKNIWLDLPAIALAGLPLAAILAALAALANGSGYLNNNGSGGLSWSTPAAGIPIATSSSFAVGTTAWDATYTGTTVLNGSTTAGSTLKPQSGSALSGTWRNDSGATIGSGNSGVWTRTV